MARSVATFQKDSFRKARGGKSRWLLLKCEKCEHPVCFYQKDGPGLLKRLYIDRITSLPKTVLDKHFTCSSCNTLLGVGMVYEKEKRRAYRLFVGAVTKEILSEREVKKLIT